MRPLIKRLEVRAGFWSLFDQGAVSLGNFLTQMLLARNLSWSDYGVFALIYGLLFFLVNSVGSLVTYPLSLKGASVSSADLPRLAGASLWFNAGLLVLEAPIVFCAVAVLHHTSLFLSVLLALAFWQTGPARGGSDHSCRYERSKGAWVEAQDQHPRRARALHQLHRRKSVEA